MNSNRPKILVVILISCISASAQDLSEKNDGDMFLKVAENNGLTDQQFNVLWEDLQRSVERARIQKRHDYWREQTVDIYPFLLFLLGKGDFPLNNKGGNYMGICKSKLWIWLGQTRDKRAVEYLMSIVRIQFTQGIETFEQIDVLRSMFHGLGYSNDKRALDYLLSIQSDAFWSTKDAPRIQVPTQGNVSTEQNKEEAKDRIKEMAFIAILNSNTQYAIELFATSQEFGGVQGGCFEQAVRGYVGIVGVPESFGKPLSADQIKQINEIYSEYGGTYTPKKIEKSNNNLSIPHQAYDAGVVY